MSSSKIALASDTAHDKNNGPRREWLYPTTPCRTKRYEPRTSYPAPPHDFPLSAGKYLGEHHGEPAPPYNGGNVWQKFTHPEGKVYHAIGSCPRIITEGDVSTGNVSKVASAWAAFILAWAEESDFHLTAFHELFVDVELDTGICDYYFVDHGSRVTFWLEDSNTSELGLPSACSDNHLRFALEENYWKHVEMFGMHLSAQSFIKDPVKQLVGIYLHGRADLATSDTSTFYFAPGVTDAHLGILERCQAIQDDPIIYAFVGRLWGFVCNHRFQNFHGEEHCRLDRTTSVLRCDEERQSFCLHFISAGLLFGLPESIRRQLHEQMVDGLVVERVWSAFISDQTAEWTKVMQWTLALAIANTLIAAVFPVPMIAYIALVLTSTGLLLSTFLSQRFQSLAKDVDDACAFLTEQNGNMMPLAMIFSLPRAAFIWSLILLVAQAMIILFFSVPLPVGVSACIAVPLLALYIAWSVYPMQRLALWWQLRRLSEHLRLCISSWCHRERIPDEECGGSPQAAALLFHASRHQRPALTGPVFYALWHLPYAAAIMMVYGAPATSYGGVWSEGGSAGSGSGPSMKGDSPTAYRDPSPAMSTSKSYTTPSTSSASSPPVRSGSSNIPTRFRARNKASVPEPVDFTSESDVDMNSEPATSPPPSSEATSSTSPPPSNAALPQSFAHPYSTTPNMSSNYRMSPYPSTSLPVYGYTGYSLASQSYTTSRPGMPAQTSALDVQKLYSTTRQPTGAIPSVPHYRIPVTTATSGLSYSPGQRYATSEIYARTAARRTTTVAPVKDAELTNIDPPTGKYKCMLQDEDGTVCNMEVDHGRPHIRDHNADVHGQKWEARGASKLRVHCTWAGCSSKADQMDFPEYFRHLVTTHLEYTRFQCSACGKKFTRSDAGKRHVAAHNRLAVERAGTSGSGSGSEQTPSS
ncbi:unnamed protein product [Peniophora sp. CBMAI 1063]|nr:unnamed protein product [Peniophora sp. CBMAI 1063]